MNAIVENRAGLFTPREAELPKVYVIHENEEWVKPLWDELNLLGVPYESWFVNNGGFDLNSLPPDGIFYNRMSASSHTRGHRYAVELANPLINWLENHGRRVINGSETVQLEVNKANQYIKLNAAGIRTPKTFVANHPRQIVEFALQFDGQPFIVKPNRGGKGLGVQLFYSVESLKSQLENNEMESIDGIFLVQEYIKPPTSEIVRMEFIGGGFYYAVAVDTSGGFELCPADACDIEDQFCPTGSNDSEKPKFQIIRDFENPDLVKIERFLNQQQIDVAGIEFITDETGQRFVYDINTNTNYNSDAERATDFEWKGMRALAGYLKSELELSYKVSSL